MDIEKQLFNHVLHCNFTRWKTCFKIILITLHQIIMRSDFPNKKSNRFYIAFLLLIWIFNLSLNLFFSLSLDPAKCSETSASALQNTTLYYQISQLQNGNFYFHFISNEFELNETTDNENDKIIITGIFPVKEFFENNCSITTKDALPKVLPKAFGEGASPLQLYALYQSRRTFHTA